ncbi:MAG: prolipoprotein diacylglyceryl transferase [Anaerolineae bacterium]|nr:prolipoprotein diacylglyceryl transferase [Anaerolineae bacterium]
MPSPTEPIIFQLGPFAIRWYGLLIVTGALLGAYIATLEARRRGEDANHVWDLLVWCMIFGIIGARLYHIFSSPVGGNRGFDYYFIENPFTTLSLFGVQIPFPTALVIWQGGIGIFGALVGGFLAVILYTKRHNLNLWRWLDILAPGMLLAQAIGRWGNYFNQELYGPPTTLPWGITITNVNQRIPPYDDLTIYPLTTTFHPVFFYESMWNLIGFGLLLWLSRKYADKWLDGDMFSFYLIWYPVGRAIIESLRPDAWTLSGIPTAQIVSFALIALGLGLFFWRRAKTSPPSSHNTPHSSSPT